jgi:ABC-type transport system substrate-binding protein
MDTEEFALRPVGTGPFAVESWSDTEIVAKAYMKSWRLPKLDALTVKVVPDDAARLASLIAGQLDVAMWLTPEDQAVVTAGGGQLVSRREPSLQTISFATAKRSPLQDPRVRVALNLAVDRKRIVEALLANNTEPATQFALPTNFGFDPAMEAFPHDPARARVMLSDAGYYRGFTMVVAIPPGHSQAVYQQIASDLAGVYVKMELRQVTMAQYAQHLSDGSWPGAAFANAQTMTDPVETMKGTLCAVKASFHCPVEISRLLDKARGEFDVAARMAAIQEIHRLQRMDPPALILWQGVAFDGVAAGVGGWKVVQDVIKFEDIEKK